MRRLRERREEVEVPAGDNVVLTGPAKLLERELAERLLAGPLIRQDGRVSGSSGATVTVIFADVESPISLEFLTRYPTPAAAAQSAAPVAAACAPARRLIRGATVFRS